MNCKEIGDAIKKVRAERRELNAEKIRIENELPKSKYPTAAEVAAYLKSELGMPEMLANSILAGDPTPEGRLKTAEAEKKTGIDALDAINSLNETRKTEGMKFAWERARSSLRAFMERGINSLPRGLDASINAWTRKWSGRLSAEKIGVTKDGKDVYAGSSVATELRINFDKLNGTDAVKATGFNRQQVDEALNMIGHARSSDISGTLGKYSKELEAKTNANPNSPAYRVMLESVNNAKRLYTSSPEVRQFMQDYFNKLDAASVAFKQVGVMEKGETRNNYYHNSIAVMNEMDPVDKALEGGRYRTSDFRESKKYANGIEYTLDKGKLPANPSFIDNASFYWLQTAKVLRRYNSAKELRAQGNVSDPKSQWTITTNGYADRVLATRPSGSGEWESPKTGDGRRYQNLESISPQLTGVYAHPDFFEWASQAMTGALKMEGIAGRYMQINQGWKNSILAFGMGTFGVKGPAGGALSVHGGSLTMKAAALGKALGVEAWYKPWSVVGKGLQAAASYDSRFLELIDHGTVVGQHDAQGLVRGLGDYNVMTGTKTTWGKLKEVLGNQHETLFKQYQPGIKIGMGLEIMETSWFRDMAKSKGRDYALDTLSKALNDNFGGQNLELMGRSKFVQTWLQAAFLAPDWQESKIRRLVGTVAADQPELRDAYRKAIGVQVAMMAVTHLAVSQLAQSILGAPKQSMEEIMIDCLRGNFGRPIIGRTADGKDIRARTTLSGIEDTRPILVLVKGIWESITGKTYEGEVAPIAKMESPLGLPFNEQRLYLPIVNDAWTEFKNKMAPVPKGFVSGGEKMAEAARARPPKPGAPVKMPEATPFDTSAYPFPIPIQQAIYSVRGGYAKDPAERALWALLVAGASTAGVPIETSKGKAYIEQKKAEAKRKSSMKLKTTD